MCGESLWQEEKLNFSIYPVQFYKPVCNLKCFYATFSKCDL